MAEDWFTQNAPTPSPAAAGGADWFAKNAPKSIPGMEKLGALPGAAAAPIPGRLDNVTKDPRGLLRRTYERDVDALAAVAGGASRAIHADSRDEAAGGLHDAIGGGMTLAEPLLGAGLVAAPLAALTGLATSAGGGKLAQMGAAAAGATENESALAGDLGALLAGMGGVKAADALPRSLPVIRGGLSGLAKGLAEAAPEMIEKLPIIRALGPLKNVPAAVVDAMAKQRAAENGGLTPAQDAILQRYLNANPGPMSLQDLGEISPQDLAAPADPTTAKAQQPAPLSPAVQSILDEATRTPTAPAPRVPVWQNPAITEPIAQRVAPSPAPAPTNLAELADPAALRQIAQPSPVDPTPPAPPPAPPTSPADLGDTDALRASEAARVAHLRNPPPPDPNLSGQLQEILGRLREQNPGFDGPPEPPPPTLEELLQQSLDAVKAKKSLVDVARDLTKPAKPPRKRVKAEPATLEEQLQQSLDAVKAKKNGEVAGKIGREGIE